jgi:prefoldin subunit 5
MDLQTAKDFIEDLQLEVAQLRELQVELMRLQEEVKRLELLLQTEIYYGQKSADEIERLRNQVRQLETERDQWQRMAVRNDS